MSIHSVNSTLRSAAAIAGVSFAFTILTPLSPANAAILNVGSNQTFKTIQGAVNAAKAGDQININPGTYGCANINKSNLFIQGVGSSQPVITGSSCGGKGLFVVSGQNTTIKNLAFKNASTGAGNGAGIRMQGTNLTVLNSLFANNQNGILSDYNVQSTITVRDSTFNHNGSCVGSGCAHGIYAGHIGKLDVQNSTFNNTQSGHHIKSRANNTVVVGNKITDGPNGTSSYLVDIPNGGAVTITGNQFQKGAKSNNPSAAIMMGAEGATNPAGAMLIANNTFQNDRTKTQAFVWNRTGNSNLTVSGNVMTGLPTTLLKGLGTCDNAPPADARAYALASLDGDAAAAANFATTPARFAGASAASVPEPGTLSTFGAMVLGLAWLLRRRKGSDT